MLSRLIYASRAKNVVSLEVIRRIIDASILKNHVRGITGMLCCVEDRFLQVLEGERLAIAETMTRIYSDPRHEDVCLISVHDIETRDFASWEMGYASLGEVSRAIIETYVPDLVLDGAQLRADVALEMLLELRPAVKRQTAELLAWNLSGT